MTTGEKIAKLRKESNYTQEQLAEILGVTRQAVSRWESDLAYPETATLISIGKLFGCSMDYLLKEDADESGAKIQVKYVEVDTSRKSREYQLGLLLSCFTFAPLVGWIVAFFAIRHARRNGDKVRLRLSVAGMIVSLVLTAVMVIGITLNL